MKPLEAICIVCIAKLRNKVSNTKNKEKKDYFKDQIENAKDSKEMWKTLKELVPNRSKKAVEVKRVLNNEKEETDPKKIANVMKIAKFKKNDKIENLKKGPTSLSNLKQQQLERLAR